MTIKIPKPKDLQALFSRAKSDADTHGISYSGDIHGGSASGMVFEGSYSVDADYITIHVRKKPLLATAAKIEAEVKKYIGD